MKRRFISLFEIAFIVNTEKPRILREIFDRVRGGLRSQTFIRIRKKVDISVLNNSFYKCRETLISETSTTITGQIEKANV